MRVALVTPFAVDTRSGVSRQVLGLYRELTRLGHTASILAPGPSSPEAECHAVLPVGNAIPIPTNGAIAHILLNPAVARQVHATLRQQRPDVIHIHDPLTPLLPFLAFEAARALRIPVVGTFHAYRDRPPRWTFPFLPYLRRVIGGIDQRIAVSIPARDYARMYRDLPFDVIPNGIDTDRFAPPSPPPSSGQRARRVLFVGRFDEPRKGLSVLLRAMELVWRERPDVGLVVVGPGDAAKAIAASGIASLGAVEFAGPVPDDALPAFYWQGDVFCAPSTGGESFGLVVAQAMAAGVPVVASAIPGYASVLTHDQEGWLVPPYDPRALADALLSLLDDPERRQRYGTAGTTAAAAFAWPAVSGRVIAAYERALAGFPGASPRAVDDSPGDIA